MFIFCFSLLFLFLQAYFSFIWALQRFLVISKSVLFELSVPPAMNFPQHKKSLNLLIMRAMTKTGVVTISHGYHVITKYSPVLLSTFSSTKKINLVLGS